MSFRMEEGPGNSRVFGQIDDLPNITRKSMRRVWFKFGKDLKHEANAEILRKPKSGRVYLIRTAKGRLKRHVASKAGETHANLGGDLRRSLGWVVHGFSSMEFGFLKDPPVYAGAIEKGHLDGSIAERRSARNAIDAVESNLQQHYNQAMREELT